MGKEGVWGEGNSSEKVRVPIIGRGVVFFTFNTMGDGPINFGR